MTYIPYWYSSGTTGGGGGNQGDPIPDSLRFRGAQELVRNNVDTTTGSTSGTFSFWYKASYPIDNVIRTVFCSSFQGGEQLNVSREGQNLRVPTNSTAFNSLGGPLRDPSAWYHLVMNYDSTTTNVWINGNFFGSCPTQEDDILRFNSRCFIGSAGSVQFFEGYLADFYAIEGQALLPTAFGRFNDDGVWVPREVDFTPATMRWSDFLTTTTGWENGRPPEAAFDGETGNYARSRLVGEDIDFRPVPAIDFDNTLRVWGGPAAGQQLSLNGGAAIALNANGWTDIVTTGGGTITHINIDGNTTDAALTAIEVDGEILTNPFIWSADLFTSPSAANPLANPTGKDFGAGAGPGNAFEQADNRVAEVASSGMWMSWIPTDGYTFTNSIQVSTLRSDTANTTVRVTVDGVQTELSYTSGVNPYHWDFSGSGTLERIDIRNSLAPEGLYYITIDGQRLVDGVNSSYGANGFHLTFADPDNLGLDTSGNGNNFTATGFDTAPVGIFSTGITSSTGGFFGTPVLGFDGDVNTFVAANSNAGGTTLTWVPPTEIEFDSQIEIVVNQNNSAQYGNNAAVQGQQFTYVTVFTGSGTINADNPIVVNTTLAGSSEPEFHAIRIDGTVFVDNEGVDYDSMLDSPTQNYATLNPLIAPPFGDSTQRANLFNANLGAGTPSAGATDPLAASTISINGQHYFEFTRDVGNSTQFIALFPEYDLDWDGITNRLCSFPASSGTEGTVRIYNADGTQIAGSPFTSTADNTFEFAVDTNTGNVEVFQGGVSFGTATGWTGARVPAPVINGQTAAWEFYLNFGQLPFLQTPPAGFEPIQTQNLPTPTILDGSDNFRALTGTGANILAIAQGTNNTGDNWNPAVNTGFANGLWWIKDMDNTNQHQLVDSVRGNTTALQCPNKQEAAYIAPAGDSVAWCWNAPDTFTPTVTGGLTNVTARRNVDAGFSIIAYTGSAQTGTITHGLDESPEFMITKIRTGALGDGTAQPIFQVRHKDLTGGMTSVTGAGGILALNLPNAQFGNTHGTVTVTADGTGIQTNIAGGQTGTADSLWWQSGADGEDYIAYCWAPVPGYSAFGSYTGNGSTTGDGPFIYLGFRPALIICKCSSDAGSWRMFDSTRSPNNVVNNLLVADSQAAEITTNQMDFLSNGFKIRSADNQLNGSGRTFIYFAVAENPFGGNNVSPANAR